MKKYFYLLLGAAVLFATSCKKDDEGAKIEKSGVVGEWHQTKWNNETPAEFDIYIEFLADGRFNIYQRFQTSAYEHYTGTFTVAASLLKGVYSDGVAWSCDYNFAVSGNKLTLTTLTDPQEVGEYTKESIPSSIRETRSTGSELNQSAQRPL